MPSAEAYYSDNNSYGGMTVGKLKSIDSGLASAVVVKSASSAAYCLTATVGGFTSYFKGPGGIVTLTAVC